LVFEVSIPATSQTGLWGQNSTAGKRVQYPKSGCNLIVRMTKARRQTVQDRIFYGLHSRTCGGRCSKPHFFVRGRVRRRWNSRTSRTASLFVSSRNVRAIRRRKGASLGPFDGWRGAYHVFSSSPLGRDSVGDEKGRSGGGFRSILEDERSLLPRAVRRVPPQY